MVVTVITLLFRSQHKLAEGFCYSTYIQPPIASVPVDPLCGNPKLMSGWSVYFHKKT